MTGHRTAFALAAPLVSALAALAGCATVANVLTGSDGGSSTDGATDPPADAAPDSRGTNPDAVGPVVPEAGAPDAPTEPSDAPVDAPTEASDSPADAPTEPSDAPIEAPTELPDAATCAALRDAALAQYQPIVLENLSCSQNSDCAWSGPATSAGWCVNACDVLTDQAGVAPVQAAGEQACEDYIAQGCPTQVALSCADGGPPVCLVGTCVSDFSVTSIAAETKGTSTLAPGACQAFALGFSYPVAEGFGLQEEAPQDMSIPVTGISNATLYSDENCATPLPAQSIMIPAGSRYATFSVLPTTVGTCGFTLNEVAYDYTVQ